MLRDSLKIEQGFAHEDANVLLLHGRLGGTLIGWVRSVSSVTSV